MSPVSSPRSLAAALAFAVVCAGWPAVGPLRAAEPKEVIAAKVRTQGHSCTNPQSAKRDPERSKPDQPVWVLRCQEATYRVKMIPDMRAKIVRLE